MYHIVYLTTNLINNKIYVGVHSTYNLNDGYLGSGTTLLKAIKKYGKPNFKRDILHMCISEEDTLCWESCIVDDVFVSRSDTYNIKLGGGNKVPHTDEIKSKLRKTQLGRKATPETRKKLSQSRKGKALSLANRTGISNALKGKPKSKAHIERRAQTVKEQGTLKGSRNPNSKSYICIAPDGTSHHMKGTITNFCKEHGFDYSQVRSYFNTGRIERCRSSKYLHWEFIKQ